MILAQFTPTVFLVSNLDTNFSIRIDSFLSQKLTGYSRNQIQHMIKLGLVFVNEVQTFSNSTKLKNNDTIRILVDNTLNDTRPKVSNTKQEKLYPLDVIYDDEHLAVINKPPNLSVYPGAGKTQPTLLDSLLDHFGKDNLYGEENRPGFVHRIDKDTTGLLIITKTKQAYTKLKNDLKNRAIDRYYLAVCSNHPKTFMELKNLIIRDDNNINKRKVVRYSNKENNNAKEALSYIFHLAELNSNFSILVGKLLTGRTHQLRIQLEFAGFPIYGDKLYNRGQKPPITNLELKSSNILVQKKFRRQALHAFNLNFNHPITAKKINISIPPPNDMIELIKSMNDDFNWESYLPQIEKILTLFK